MSCDGPGPGASQGRRRRDVELRGHYDETLELIRFEERLGFAGSSWDLVSEQTNESSVCGEGERIGWTTFRDLAHFE
jgi:hypothetical protein